MIAWSRVTLAAAVLLPIAWQRGAKTSVGGRASAGAIFAFAIVEFVVPFSAGSRWASAGIDSSTAGDPHCVCAAHGYPDLPIFRGARAAGNVASNRVWLVGLLGVGRAAGIGHSELAARLGRVLGCMLLATFGYAVGPLIIQKYLKGLDSIGAHRVKYGGASSVLLLIPAAVTLPATAPSALRTHFDRGS